MVKAGSSRAVARPGGEERDSAALARDRPDAERVDAALAAALAQIRAPAFVLSERGEIREVNGPALERLAEDAGAISAALRESALENDVRTFDVTVLRRGDELVGFLAIERQSPALLVARAEGRISLAARRWSLTRRQAQVLSLVADGSTNARIAAQLGISERTAEDHVAAILTRASAATRLELVASLLSGFA